MDKNVKQTKAARAQAEEAALNRILCWVAGGSVLEVLLMLLNRYWVHYGPATLDLRLALGKIIPFIGAAAVVAAAAGIYWWNKSYQAGKSCNLPGLVSLFCVGCAVSCFGTWLFNGSAILVMSRVVPVVVVLALIYYLYQREFFVIALDGALAIVGVWILDRGMGGRLTVICWLYLICAALLIGAVTFLCRKLQTGNGKLEWKGKKHRLLAKDANYIFIYVGAAAALAILLCSLLPLPTMLLYAAMVSWLLVMAVYYTVKMM